MKQTLKFFVMVVAVTFFQCGGNDPDPIPNVPFTFSVNETSTDVAVINVAQEITGALVVSDGSSPKFTLVVTEKNSKAFSLTVNGVAYSDNMLVTKGDLDFSVSAAVKGDYVFDFVVSNEAKTTSKVTYSARFRDYPTYGFTVDVSPADITNIELKTNTYADFNINITTAAPGDLKYKLTYSDDAAWVYSATSVSYPNGSLLPQRSLGMKLYVPGGVSVGIHTITLTFEDQNGDKVEKTIKYKVVDNYSPKVLSIGSNLTFSNVTTLSGADGEASCYKYGCWSPDINNVKSIYTAATNFAMTVNFSDTDGQVSNLKVKINGVETIYSVTGTSKLINIPLGTSYWQRYLSDVTSGTCTGSFKLYYPVNGKKYADGSGNCKVIGFPVWEVASGTSITLSVQDASGLWSAEKVVLSPNESELVNVDPTTL